MAQRTQIRMGALSGTFGTADGAINDQEAAVATGSIVADGLDDILSHMASSVKRLHGHTSFSANAAGTFYTDVLPSADDTLDLGSASAAWQDLHLEGDVLMTDAGKVSTAAGDMTVESAAAGVTIDAATTVKIDSDSGDISFEDGGVAQLAIDMDGEATGIVIQPKVASDDLIFKTQGGTEALRIEDDAAVDFGGGAGSSGVTITAAGQVTADGRVIVDDATEATSTTDGSIQTDGGLSVAKSVVIGDDLDLLSNSAILKVGSDQPFTLTHSNANNTVMASSGHRLAFGDAGEYISGDGTDLDIISSGDLDITATLVDVTGALTVSGLTTATGRVVVDDTTEATSATDGSLQTDGGLSVAKSAVIGDDLDLLSNSAVLKVGVAQPFTLTHANANNTLLASANHRLAFGDAGDYIAGDGTDISIVGSNEINLDATTVDVNASMDISANLTVAGNLTVSGQTTTLDSVNTTLKDRIFAIASGSSPGDVDSGIVFTRSTADLGGGSDKKHGALLFDGGSGNVFKVGVTNDSGESNTLTVADDDLGELYVGKLYLDGATNHIDVASSDVTVTAAQDFVVDATRDIILDVDNADVMLKDAGTQFLKFTNASGDAEIYNGVADKDIIFKDLAGNEVFRMDGSAESLKMAASKRLQLGAAEEALYGDGTDIHFEVGANGDINIPADIGLTFGDDGERIEGDGTDLSVYGNIINLVPTTDVVLPNDKGIVFGGAGEKIEGDGSKLVIAAANLDLTMEAGGDVVLPNDIGMIFGDAAEKIEGNGTKLTISSSDAIDLTATTDVVLPANVGMVFGDAGEKIEGNGSRLTVSSGVGMMLDAEGTIIIDSDNGIVTFEDGGVNHGAIAMTGGAYVIAANKTMVLSSSQGVVEYSDDGVSYLRILKSGNDTILSSSIDNGDIKFHADDDVEVFKIDGAEKAAIFGSGRKLCFADTGEFIEGDGTNLSIGSGGEIQLLAGTDITFDANGGDFVFADDSSVGMSIDIDASAGDALFMDAGGQEIFRLDGSANSLLMAGTNRIDFNDAGTTINSSANGSLNVNADGTAVDAIDLRADQGGVKLDAGLDGDAAAIHLDSASGVTIAGGDQNDSVYIENSPLRLEQIAAPSSATDKLYNVGGALYWNGSAISDTSQKQIFKLEAPVSAGSNISGDAGATTFNVSNIVTADHLKKVDVFVNGQMMMSGSETQRAAALADYHMIGTRAGGNDNAVELQFGFALEADDVVQVSVK